mmetsp:Transcript_44533/g.67127  ORF Transcript_44533/g.67127 Transcript_44533/m.67127 type:complete len:100 (-) Transcript_44533:364-663(-)
MVESGIKRALVFYPNSGEEWDASNETWVKGTGCTSPKEFASLLSKAIGAVDDTWNEVVKSGKVGSSGNNCSGGCSNIPIVVGGCCRTDPSTISAIRGVL